MGNNRRNNNPPTKKQSIIKQIFNSKIYIMISKLVSFLITLLLIFLVCLGAPLLYFKMQSKVAEEKGLEYVPPFGLYTIVSGSMRPSIEVYDVVVVRKVKDISEIKVGDIIEFKSTWDVNYGAQITHRVVSISKLENGTYQFTTKGDNNPVADGAVVTQKNLVGKVVMRIPQLGRVQFFFSTKLGWFSFVFIPAMYIVISDAIKILKLRVLKDNIDNIKDVKEADKIYFENERLDNRDLEDYRLSKTSVVELPLEKEVKLVNDTNVKLKSDVNKDNFTRKPLKTRETPSKKKTTKKTSSNSKKQKNNGK